jgi:hypothetical protein
MAALEGLLPKSLFVYGNCLKSGDCFVASLLAMTSEKTFCEFIKMHEQKAFQSACGGLKRISIWAPARGDPGQGFLAWDPAFHKPQSHLTSAVYQPVIWFCDVGRESDYNS